MKSFNIAPTMPGLHQNGLHQNGLHQNVAVFAAVVRVGHNPDVKAIVGVTNVGVTTIGVTNGR
jgi:hypothetical protein